jgi:CheY-like chemotaxis protein
MDNGLTDCSSVVLVVEDEELVREYAVTVFEDAGYVTLEADDARSALELLNERSDVRAVFTDVQLPGPLDGFELARRVHERWPEILLLVTSGNRTPSKAELPKAGQFIPKPYRADDVLQKINTLARDAGAR